MLVPCEQYHLLGHAASARARSGNGKLYFKIVTQKKEMREKKCYENYALGFFPPCSKFNELHTEVMRWEKNV